MKKIVTLALLAMLIGLVQADYEVLVSYESNGSSTFSQNVYSPSLIYSSNMNTNGSATMNSYMVFPDNSGEISYLFQQYTQLTNIVNNNRISRTTIDNRITNTIINSLRYIQDPQSKYTSNEKQLGSAFYTVFATKNDLKQVYSNQVILDNKINQLAYSVVALERTAERDDWLRFCEEKIWVMTQYGLSKTTCYTEDRNDRDKLGLEFYNLGNNTVVEVSRPTISELETTVELPRMEISINNHVKTFDGVTILSNPDKVIVYRNGELYKKIHVLGEATKSFIWIDTEVVDGQNYTYYVTQEWNDLESKHSNAVNTTVDETLGWPMVQVGNYLCRQDPEGNYRNCVN